jgi:cupin fold WbuC family metalloprotein
MPLIQRSPEVFLAEGPIAELGARDIAALKAGVEASPRGRARINAHADSEDALHEMIIAIGRASYIRPHKHPGKSEAFHIVEGEVDIVVFNDDGAIARVVALGAPGSDRNFYYRMSRPFFHTLVVRSRILVVHEITNGPFRPEATVFADFAPAESDMAPAASYQADLVRRVDLFMSDHAK